MRAAALLLGMIGLATSALVIRPASAGSDRIVIGHAWGIVQIAEGCGAGSGPKVA